MSRLPVFGDNASGVTGVGTGDQGEIAREPSRIGVRFECWIGSRFSAS